MLIYLSASPAVRPGSLEVVQNQTAAAHLLKGPRHQGRPKPLARHTVRRVCSSQQSSLLLENRAFKSDCVSIPATDRLPSGQFLSRLWL